MKLIKLNLIYKILCCLVRLALCYENLIKEIFSITSRSDLFIPERTCFHIVTYSGPFLFFFLPYHSSFRLLLSFSPTTPSHNEVSENCVLRSALSIKYFFMGSSDIRLFDMAIKEGKRVGKGNQGHGIRWRAANERTNENQKTSLIIDFFQNPIISVKKIGSND